MSELFIMDQLHDQVLGHTATPQRSQINPFADLDQFEAINFDTDQKEQDYQQLKQRTIEWYLARWDKFTGSRIPDLMKSGRGKGELWGETAKGIILEIAAFQQMTDEGREMYSIEQMYTDYRQTRWGNKYEPEAREKYAAHTGYMVKETGFTVHPEIPYFGGSFDGECSKFWLDEIDVSNHVSGKNSEYVHRSERGIIEIKCPADPVKHMKNQNLKLSGGINQGYEYYGQIQANIEVAGVDWCDFISYDPRCKPEYQLVIIRVMRDNLYITAMLERIHKAKRILDRYMSGRSMDEVIREVEN